jgi:hypothetical protein
VNLEIIPKPRIPLANLFFSCDLLDSKVAPTTAELSPFVASYSLKSNSYYSSEVVENESSDGRSWVIKKVGKLSGYTYLGVIY